jgi:hypothetical protein
MTGRLDEEEHMKDSELLDGLVRLQKRLPRLLLEVSEYLGIG